MPSGLIIDGDYLVYVKDLHTDEELFEINGFPLITVEIGVWE